jgi:uncharacterized membrane protein
VRSKIKSIGSMVSTLGIVVLLLLVAQTTSIILLMRYTQTAERPPGAGPIYKATVAVMMAEALKLPCCVAVVGWICGSWQEAKRVLHNELASRDTVACAVPAIAYTVQNNLLFVALANLEPPTYQVAYQSKTIFTALFSVLWLGRRLVRSQWLAVLLLTLGTVLVADMRAKPHAGSGSPTLGLSAVLSAAVLSAASGVYFERMLKKASSSGAPPAARHVTRTVRRISASLCSRVTAVRGRPACGCATSSWAPSRCRWRAWLSGRRTAATWRSTLHDRTSAAVSHRASWAECRYRYGVLQGFDGVVWCVVLLNGLGGLLVAAVMKCATRSSLRCVAPMHHGGGDVVAGTPTRSSSASPPRLPSSRARCSRCLQREPTPQSPDARVPSLLTRRLRVRISLQVPLFGFALSANFALGSEHSIS